MIAGQPYQDNHGSTIVTQVDGNGSPVTPGGPVSSDLSVGAGVTDAKTLRVVTASDGPLNTAIGGINDAAISSDATGSVSGKLRGIVKLLAAFITTLDGGPAWTTVRGVAGVPFASADQHSAAASITDAPTAGQKIVLDDLIISCDTAMWVKIVEETSATVRWGPHYFSANAGPSQITMRGKWKHAVADKKFQVLTSVSGNITVDAGYHSES